MTRAITLSRVAALCLLAGVAHASPVPAADGSIAVPATVYTPAAAWRPASPEASSPNRAWVAQNRVVAAYDSMMLTMGAHGAGQHAGHAAPATDPHAGHDMHGGAHDGHTGASDAGSCCASGACGKDACCCKGSAGAMSGAAMGGCCGKAGANAPQSCAPALPAPGAAPAGAHQHGGHS